MVTRRGATPSASVIRLSALLAVLALVATACGGTGDDDASDGSGDDRLVQDRDEGEPQAGGSITVALEAETANWNPATGNWAPSGYNVAYAIYDPLMSRTAEGTPEPNLAESLEPNEDLTEWTLTLREGVQFHDGTPLDAEAVRHNLAVYTDPSSVLSGVLEQAGFESFEVTGDLTGVYRLAEPNAAFADLLAVAPGVVFSPTAYDADPEGFGEDPVGTGAFVFESWNRDDRLVVSRNEDYWRDGLPYLDEIVFRPIPDEDARLQSLLSGDVDAMTSLRQSIVQDALDAQERDEVEATVHIGNNGGGVIFNTLEPPVDDVRVRQGLAWALDQEGLIAVLGGTGLTPPQTQYFSPDSPYYSEEVAEAWPSNDPERAQELLDEYVNDPGRSDGKAPGEPIELEFTCPPDPSLNELSQAYQQYWEQVGVQTTLRSVEQATHIANAIGSEQSDPPFRGEYTANCWRAGGEGDPYTVLSAAFGPPESSPQNFTNFHDDVVEQTLDTLQTSTDQDARIEAAQELMMHFTEEVPNLWTAGTASMIATLPAVNGVGQWDTPDGVEGSGTPEGITRWSQVWVDQ